MQVLLKIIFHIIAICLFFFGGITILFGPVVTNSGGGDDILLVIGGVFIIGLGILLEVIIHYLTGKGKKKS